MYCPACGKAIADGSAFCMFCGKPTNINQQPITVMPAAVQTAPNAPVCPNCGQMDAVRRAEGILAEGISLGQSTTITQGSSFGIAGATGTGGKAIALSSQVYSSTSETRSLNTTVLAAILASLPETVSEHNWSLMQSERGDVTQAPPLRAEPQMAELRFRDYLVHMEAQSRLDRLFYCSRCAGAFLMPERTFALLDRADSLLFHYYPDMDDREICQTLYYPWNDPKKHYMDSYRNTFVALAYGANRVFKVHEIDYPEWRRGDKGYSLVPKDSTKSHGNFDQMLTDLQRMGWTKLGQTGPNWWEVSFTRPSL